MTNFNLSTQEAPIDIQYTSYQGEFIATYRDLVACFGTPSDDGDGYKVDANWVIGFPDGTVATVYNYKNGVNYNGAEGTPTVDLTDWHIGGHSTKAVEWVHKALESCGVPFQPQK